MFVCPIDNRVFKTQAALQQHTLSSHKKKTTPASGSRSAPRRRRSGPSLAMPGMASGSNGAFTRFRNKELLCEVKFDKKAFTLHFGKHFKLDGDAAILNKISGIYDSYRIKAVRYHFVTAMSSNVSGIIALAVDPGTKKYPGDFKATMAANPHVSGPIHTNRLTIVVPTAWCNPMLMREVKQANAEPFQVIISVSMAVEQAASTVVGYVEVDYDVELSGITP